MAPYCLSIATQGAANKGGFSIKVKAIILRVFVVIGCFIAEIYTISQFSAFKQDAFLFALLLSIPIIIGWIMLKSIFKILKATTPYIPILQRIKAKNKANLAHKNSIAEWKKEQIKRKYPTNEYRNGLISAAELLSDGNAEIAFSLQCYEPDANTTVYIFDVFLQLLTSHGFVGVSDGKFNLDDLLFNFQKAFEYYGIDGSPYDAISKKHDIMPPRAFQEIRKYLPGEFALGLIHTLSKQYYAVIAPQDKMLMAKKQLESIGEILEIIEPEPE